MQRPKILVIMQTRVGSTRLPGKVTKDILGKTVLEHDLERIKEMKEINGIVVATTTKQEDDVILKITQEYDAKVMTYRGSEKDVLDRYYEAAKKFGADIIVRITSDCPLIDPQVSDKVVKEFLKEKCDYCCNNIPPTYPHGLDTEVFSFEALERAWKEAKQPHEREHVTPYIREHPDRFVVRSIANNKDLHVLRWTLDYPEDFEFINEVYQRIYPEKKNFCMEDILVLLEKEPSLVKINEKHVVK